MISRSGTFSSGAVRGLAKILREEGSGPVVTAGRVVSGLERMFMGSSVYIVGVAARETSTAVIPAKAGIQYSRGLSEMRRSRGVLDRPVLVRNCALGRAMTVECVASTFISRGLRIRAK